LASFAGGGLLGGVRWFGFWVRPSLVFYPSRTLAPHFLPHIQPAGFLWFSSEFSAADRGLRRCRPGNQKRITSPERIALASLPPPPSLHRVVQEMCLHVYRRSMFSAFMTLSLSRPRPTRACARISPLKFLVDFLQGSVWKIAIRAAGDVIHLSGSRPPSDGRTTFTFFGSLVLPVPSRAGASLCVIHCHSVRP